MEDKNSTIISDMVYQHIKDMIMRKEIQCGEKISEQKIAVQLKVSRTPIRDAIRTLAMEGLIKIYPNRFAEVITFDSESIKNLGIIRMTLDTLAVKLVIYNGSNRDFGDLKQIAEKCLDAAMNNDLVGRMKYDAEFHLKLNEIAHNEFLYNFQKNTHQLIQLWQATVLENAGDRLEFAKDHILIADTLLERDSAKVIKLVQNHLYNFYEPHLNASDKSALQAIML